MTARILVVDDQETFRVLMKGALEESGFEVACAAGGEEALAALASPVDLVVTDLVMPGMDGISLMRQARQRHPGLPFVVATAYGSVDTAVAALREGACDYLLKPVLRDELRLVVARALGQWACPDLGQPLRFQDLSSRSPAMVQALEGARRVAAFPDTTVTLLGESGVGKEVLARAIHAASGLDPARFVAVNCAAIPDQLLEDELFGHVKGAFTGAGEDREGKCGRARGGTLFLDEIGDMPPLLQGKVLRLLENRTYEPVGSDRSVEATFRIMVATHRDLEAACRQGAFRWDLFHRLNVFPIAIPPLRERREDIPTLAQDCLRHLRLHLGGSPPTLEAGAVEYLQAQPWPGNVRELRNRLERAAILAEGAPIAARHLHLSPEGQPLPEDTLALSLALPREGFSLEAVTRQVMTWALERCQGNKSAAARLLNVSRKAFYD